MSFVAWIVGQLAALAVPVAPAAPPPVAERACEPVPRGTDEAILSRYYVSDGCGASGRADLTGDGVADCWSAIYSGGSGYGGFTASVDPSCQGAWETIDEASSFAEMIQAVPIPRGATDAHVTAWITLLWGAGDVAAAPDAAAVWLMDHARGRVAETPVRPATRWQPGRPRTALRGQTLIMSGRIADDLVRALADTEDVTPTGRAFVRTMKQRPLVEAARCPRYTIYRSVHGVAVYDRGGRRWAWLYLWTGIDKLRHDGVGKVTCRGADQVVAAVRGDGEDGRVVLAP